MNRRLILPGVLLVLGLVLAIVFRGQLVAWFTGKPVGKLSGEPTTTQAGADLAISLAFSPDPPREKDNTLRIALRDREGKPVTEPEPKLRYSMPAMGAMPEMKGEADVKRDAPGVYLAKFSVPMGGTWTLELEAGEVSARYTFTVGRKGLTEVSSSASGAAKKREPELSPLPPFELPAPALASVETAFAAYEEIRARLAGDALEGVPAAARRIEQSLRAAAASVKDPPEAKQCLEEGAEAAKLLAGETELEPARIAFGEVSRALVRLAAADPRLGKGKHVFECPMTKGFSRWLQPSEQMANPYMGKKMLLCGSEVELQPAEGEHESHALVPGGESIAHYTCPMHPSVKQAGPGACPICGMDLTPVTRQEVETGVILVDAARRQLIGVKTAPVETRKIEKTIRTVGKIATDESRIVDVTLKFQGFIGKLYADTRGSRVKRGQTLFTVYSPDVYQAQQDLLIARRVGGDGGLAVLGSNNLVDSARRRLELWDVPKGTINRVLEKGEPIRYVPISSPASGYLTEKHIYEGSGVEPGMLLMRIANLDKVWIEAELYESELPLVAKGQPATVSLPYVPDREFTGKVTYVYPYLSGETRTGKVRIELDNKKVELLPDMYTNVELTIDRGERLVVPESAVIYAGKRRLVFLDLGAGKLRPQEVQVGGKSGDWYEVLSGLRAGQKVVTSGNFLIAAESRLKTATGQW
jgi:membrane fusion protein, copper/silver efflux system